MPKVGSNKLKVKQFTAISSNTNNIILYFPAVLFLELLVTPQSYSLKRRRRAINHKMKANQVAWWITHRIDEAVWFRDIRLTLNKQPWVFVSSFICESGLCFSQVLICYVAAILVSCKGGCISTVCSGGVIPKILVQLLLKFLLGLLGQLGKLVIQPWRNKFLVFFTYSLIRHLHFIKAKLFYCCLLTH